MATLNDTTIATVACTGRTIREINRELRERIENGAHHLRLTDPAGRHNLAVALLRPTTIEVDGSAGYFLGGMMDGPRILVHGNCGWSAGETMLSGEIVVDGHAGNSVAASMRGGTVVVRGDAGARAGIAMKGGLLLIGGSVGYMSGFMMQRGTVVICGDAGPAIGDSLYEGRIYVAGSVKSPGTDAVVSEANDEDEHFLREALTRYNLPWPGAFKKIEAGRRLWNFSKKEIGVWIEAL